MSTSSFIRCDHIECLIEKWQPHFELKWWVWPMIKCPHLTPKSIYSNIGDLVADLYLDEVHMFWSLSIFSYVLSLSFLYTKKKKTSSRISFYLFSYISLCISFWKSFSGSDQFPENLLQIHCQSFETSLAEWAGLFLCFLGFIFQDITFCSSTQS